MKQVKTIPQLLAETDLSRTDLEKAILAQDPVNFEVQGVCGAWSIKDIMAHVTAWEKRMMEWLDQILLDGVSADFLGPEIEEDAFDEYNAKIYALYKDFDLQKIKTAFMENHQAIMDYVARLPEERLFLRGPSAFEQEHPLWRVVAGNTYWHYEEHLAQIEKQPWFHKPKK